MQLFSSDNKHLDQMKFERIASLEKNVILMDFEESVS